MAERYRDYIELDDIQPISSRRIDSKPKECEQKQRNTDKLILDKVSRFDDLELDIKPKRMNFDQAITDDIKQKHKRDDYDENGMNLLHYCIWKNHVSTVLKLLDCGYDPEHPTSHGLTPIKLILKKYEKFMNKDMEYNKENDKTFMMVQSLLKLGVAINTSYLEVAVNFPLFLESILKNLPGYYEILPEKVNDFFSSDFVTMGFFESMLNYCDKIILKMLTDNNCSDFLQEYKDDNDQALLHSAAKLFKLQIVEELMKDSRFADSYNTPDKNKQTPITIVLAEWERQKFFATIKGDKIKPEVKKGAPAVIAEILSKIPEADERISAIKQNYHGMTAVEYDIKSRNGVIVEAIFKLKNDKCKELLSANYNLGNIMHIVARYGFPLKIFEDKLENDVFHDLFDALNRSNKKPCDYAIEYGHTKFIQEACNSKQLRNIWENDELAEVPVPAVKGHGKDWSHEIKTACKFGNLDALYLLQYQASLQTKYEGTWGLLRIACKHNQESVVEYLLRTARMQPVMEEKEAASPTVLMLAADCDASACVKLLLDFNFSVNNTDENDDNVLCRAIKKQRKKAVMAILTHDNGKKALYFHHERHYTTPLRLLVKYMPDIAMWVLNDQIIKEENDQNIRYEYNLIDDLDHNSSRTKFHSLLHYCRNFYDASNSCISQPQRQADLEHEIIQNPEKKKLPYQATRHMLYYMVKSDSPSLDILQHKLVKKFIEHYWKKAAIFWFILRLLYVVNTLILTVFTLMLPHPNGEICAGSKTPGGRIDDYHRIVLLYLSILLNLLSIVFLIINALTLWSIGFKQICSLIKTFKRYGVFTEAILAACNLVFVAGYYKNTDDWCAENYQWHFGAICVFLSWMTVLISLQILSSQIRKLFTIITEFIFIIFLPVILLMAFFLPFLMLFTSPPCLWPDNESFNTVIFLVLGISGNYFGPHDKDDFKNFPVASYLVFIGFVIIITVLFNNLLISLAVGDLNDLQNKAEIEKYRMKISIIIDMLDLLYPIIQNKSPDEVKISDKEWSEEVLSWVERMKYNRKLSDLILKGTDEEILKQSQEDLKNKLGVLQKHCVDTENINKQREISRYIAKLDRILLKRANK